MRDKTSNAKGSAPKQPSLLASAELEPVVLADLQTSDMIDDAIIANQHETGIVANQLVIATSIVRDGSMISGNLEGLRLGDVQVQRFDWSNTLMNGGAWTRVRMEGCKLMGLQLNHARLDDVHLVDCVCDLAQFQDIRFRRTRFERCRLAGVFFNDARLAGTVFEDCDLREADFSNAELTGVDIRGCRIEDVRVSPDQLRGVKVTPDQALYLASLMGLIVDGQDFA